MKEWHMVLNLVDGVPVEAVEALEALKAANPAIKIGLIGKEGFEERVFGLSGERIASLLGPTATPVEAKTLDVAVLRKLVDDLALSAAPPPDAVDLNLVPVGKLTHNGLPTHWQMFVRSGWANAPIVASYFARHPDPLEGGPSWVPVYPEVPVAEGAEPDAWHHHDRTSGVGHWPGACAATESSSCSGFADTLLRELRHL